MSDYIIRAKGIKKYFGGVKALDGVDLEIKKGEVHCLAGENGCGKSTIINVISGFYTPDGGELEIDGVSYPKMTPQQSIAAGIQVIYQDLQKRQSQRSILKLTWMKKWKTCRLRISS